MKDCIGIIGTLFGHSFRPRYSIEGQENADPFWNSVHTYTVSRSDDPELLKHLRQPSYKKTYECDVCARCGAVVRTIDAGPPEADHA